MSENKEKVVIFVDFTPEMVKALKKAFAEAQAGGKETFIFEGHELVVAYAKYLIEYLEPMVKGGR